MNRGPAGASYTRSSGQLPTGVRSTHEQMPSVAGRSECLSYEMLNGIRIEIKHRIGFDEIVM